MPPRPRYGGLHLSALRQARDLDSMAAAIVAQSISDEPGPGSNAGKNPHAVALGRQGGLQGWKARAASLTPGQRSQIARTPAPTSRSGGRASSVKKCVNPRTASPDIAPPKIPCRVIPIRRASRTARRRTTT